MKNLNLKKTILIIVAAILVLLFASLWAKSLPPGDSNTNTLFDSKKITNATPLIKQMRSAASHVGDDQYTAYDKRTISANIGELDSLQVSRQAFHYMGSTIGTTDNDGESGGENANIDFYSDTIQGQKIFLENLNYMHGYDPTKWERVFVSSLNISLDKPRECSLEMGSVDVSEVVILCPESEFIVVGNDDSFRAALEEEEGTFFGQVVISTEEIQKAAVDNLISIRRNHGRDGLKKFIMQTNDSEDTNFFREVDVAEVYGDRGYKFYLGSYQSLGPDIISVENTEFLENIRVMVSGQLVKVGNKDEYKNEVLSVPQNENQNMALYDKLNIVILSIRAGKDF